MKRLVLTGMLVAGVAAAWPPASAAGVRVAIGIGIGGGHERGAWGVSPAYRYGYDRGWREGEDEGRHDGRCSRDPRFWRESEFRHADRGYKRWMGPRPEYVEGFRRAYESAYRRAYAAARPGWHDHGHDRWAERSPYDDRYGRR